MKYRLALAPDTFLWGVTNPTYKGNINGTDECKKSVVLLLTQTNPGPVEIDTAGLPQWAIRQIESGVAKRLVINSMEYPQPVKTAEPVKTNDDIIETVPEPIKKTGWPKGKPRGKKVENGGQANSDSDPF